MHTATLLAGRPRARWSAGSAREATRRAVRPGARAASRAAAAPLTPRVGHAADCAARRPRADRRRLDGRGRTPARRARSSTTRKRAASRGPGALTVARGSPTATRLRDGRVLVAGGSGDGGALASAELYDPRTGVFVRTGSMTVPRVRARGDAARRRPSARDGRLERRPRPREHGDVRPAYRPLPCDATDDRQALQARRGRAARRTCPRARRLGRARRARTARERRAVPAGDRALRGDGGDGARGGSSSATPSCVLRDGRVLVAGGARAPRGVRPAARDVPRAARAGSTRRAASRPRRSSATAASSSRAATTTGSARPPRPGSSRHDPGTVPGSCPLGTGVEVEVGDEAVVRQRETARSRASCRRGSRSRPTGRAPRARRSGACPRRRRSSM